MRSISVSGSRSVIRVAPPLLFLLLATPVLSFRFLSDDFSFLASAASPRFAQWLPDPGAAFYRPIPRETYFAILVALGGNNPLWGHLANAAIAAANVVLVGLIGRRLAGERVGFVSALLFAMVGGLPILAGWISGSQDLFAMLFVACAILAELSGRRWAALACISAALLSKETALFFIPGLMIARWMLGGDRRALWNAVGAYAGLCLLWAAIHPRLLTLLQQGLATGPGSYVGVDNPRLMTQVVWQSASVFNIPIGGAATAWPSELTLVACVGAVILACSLWVHERIPCKDSDSATSRGALLLAAVWGIAPALITAISSKHWFPYYACAPAIGTSILLAVGATRLNPWMKNVALLVFLLLGVWSRGFETGNRNRPIEADFRHLSRDLARVESDLKKLQPALPAGSRLHMSIQAARESSLPHHLVSLQAARVWYADPSLVTSHVEKLTAGVGPEYLFWVTSLGEVFEVRLPGLRPRTPGGPPNYTAYQKTVRGYAYGLFGIEEVDQAVMSLLTMRQRDSLTWAFDRRLASAMLIAEDRVPEAERLLAGLPALPRKGALYSLAAVLTPSVQRARFDESAFMAFGVSTEDVEAYRFLMHYYSDQRLLPQAKRMAEHILALRPRDEEANAMLAAIAMLPNWERVVAPVE